MKSYTVTDTDTWDGIAYLNNIPTSWLLLANGKSAGAALDAGDTLYIPDPPPTMAVAPSNHNVVEVGPGGFAEIALEQDAQILSALDATAGTLAPKPLKFFVALGQDATSTKFVVCDAQSNEIYSETHADGELVAAGPHTWTWDGFSTAGVFDTKVLKGKLLVKIASVRKTDSQSIEASTTINGTAHLATYADVAVDRTNKTIAATVYVTVDKAAKDATVVGAAVVAPIAAGVVAGGIGAGAGALVGVASKGSVGKDAEIGAAIGAIAGLAAGIAADAALLSKMSGLTDEKMAKATSLILEGIGVYWTRNGPRMGDGLALDAQVTIGSDPYVMTTKAEVRDHDSVTFSIMNEILSQQRPCNLGAVVSGLTILMPYQWMAEAGGDQLFRETAAHEFGHSVLRDERDHDYSITHKGSSGGALHQDPVPGNPQPAAGEIDLMKYWSSSYDDELQRSIVAEDEAKGLVSIAQVQFASS